MSVATAAVLVEEPPEFEFKDGLFWVCDCQGRRVMLPAVFFRSFHGAARALQAYHTRSGAEIVEFPKIAAV